MKKAKQLPHHHATQQVRSYQCSGNELLLHFTLTDKIFGFSYSWYMLVSDNFNCDHTELAQFSPGPYDKSYPSPSFYNPIPWKPIHVPPPETSLNKTSGKKTPKQRIHRQSPSTTYRLKNAVSAGQLLQRR